MFEDILVYSPILIPSLIGILIILYFFLPSVVGEYGHIFGEVTALLLITMPFWLPILGIIVFWNVWVIYVRSRYIAGVKYIILELKIPQEVTKSPLAMETFLMALHQTGGETTFIDRWWKGKTRPQFSLEIISIEGQIKFLIRTEERYRSLIEAGLYAQYPDIEIHDFPDYTKSVHFDPKENDLYVIDFKLAKANPYPIKTYVDYGIENEQLEEDTKIDPINHLLEFMGSIGANQQLWLQIILRGHKDDQRKPGHLFGKTDLWKDEAKAEIEKIRKGTIPKEGETKFPNPTKGEQERIAALERSVSKLPFDVGMRTVYFGQKGFYDGVHIGAIRTLLRSYTAPHLNSFKPTDWLDGFDYPWQDFRGMRQNKVKREGLEAYKRRSYFYPPFQGKQFNVLNVEELASVFHLPGQVTKTPNLERLPSKRSQAPGNLPI
jgi:hypothetical protein